MRVSENKIIQLLIGGLSVLSIDGAGAVDVEVLVWIAGTQIAETRTAEMIEIKEKPELPKWVYCTRLDFPKWTN